MAVTQTTITGPVYLADCEAPEKAKIEFALSEWDKEEGEAVFATGPYVADIDEQGEFTATLFTNSAGTNGVVYRVSVVYLLVNGQYKREFLGSMSLVGDGPFKLSEMNLTSEWVANEFDLYTEIVAMSEDVTTKHSEVENTVVTVAGMDAEIDGIKADILANDIVTQADLTAAMLDIANAFTKIPWSPGLEFTPGITFENPGDLVVEYSSDPTILGIQEKLGHQNYISIMMNRVIMTHSTASGRVRLTLPEPAATAGLGFINMRWKPAELLLPREAVNLRWLTVPNQTYAELVFDTPMRLMKLSAYNLVTPFSAGERISSVAGSTGTIEYVYYDDIAGSPDVDQYLIVSEWNPVTFVANETFTGNKGGEGTIGGSVVAHALGGTTYADASMVASGEEMLIQAATEGYTV